MAPTIAKILEMMHDDSNLCSAFKLEGHKLSFENHGNAVSTAEDSTARERNMKVQNPDGQEEETEIRGLRREPSKNRAYMYADQICLYKMPDGTNLLSFIVEYKAAHKLTLETIAEGLCPMNPLDEVVHRMSASDPKAKAQLLVAAAIT